MFVYSLISHLPIYLCSQEMLAFNLLNIKILSPKFKDRLGEKKKCQTFSCLRKGIGTVPHLSSAEHLTVLQNAVPHHAFSLLPCYL